METLENDIIKHVQTDEIEYLQFKKLLEFPSVKHAYVLKTHNMNFRIGNDFRNIDIVKSNLKVLSKNLGFKYESFLRPDYNHTNNVSKVLDVLEEERPSLKGQNYKNTDGLMTDKSGITLFSTNADCMLLLLYDKEKNIIGNIHSGWRGTFNKIPKIAIQKMKEEFNCNPKNILCFLSPSIRKCHFEVDEDVKDECEKIFNYTDNLKNIINLGEIKDNKQKYLLDIPLIVKTLLKEEGITDENIYDSGICSVCNSNYIHSRRADGIDFGLGGMFIELMNVN